MQRFRVIPGWEWRPAAETCCEDWLHVAAPHEETSGRGSVGRCCRRWDISAAARSAEWNPLARPERDLRGSARGRRQQTGYHLCVERCHRGSCDPLPWEASSLVWHPPGPPSQRHHSRSLAPLQVDMAFELFNTDGEGRISAAQLRRIFCESGGRPLTQMRSLTGCSVTSASRAAGT